MNLENWSPRRAAAGLRERRTAVNRLTKDELLSLSSPKTVASAHREYIDTGAAIVGRCCARLPDRVASVGLDLARQVVEAAVRCFSGVIIPPFSRLDVSSVWFVHGASTGANSNAAAPLIAAVSPACVFQISMSMLYTALERLAWCAM